MGKIMGTVDSRLNIIIIFIVLSLVIQSIDGGKRKRRRRSKMKPPAEAIQRPSKKTVIIKDTTKTSPQIANRRVKKDTNGLFIPISEWVGKKFILLEKTKVFRKFGYELYLSPQLSNSTLPVDPGISLKNHRLKYSPFCKKIVTVTSVEKDNQGEYLVTFIEDKSKLKLYGKTKDGIIEGLAMVSDLQVAQKRWMGKTVFCRRRYVDIYDSLKSNFTSIKVPISEPLKVIAVRWGVIPLPPKLLWLIVKLPDSTRGVIPINASWTNVIKLEKQVEFPWEHDVFEKNPKEIYTWDNFVWESIDKHNIYLGMTAQQVSFSWGEPKEKQFRFNDKGKKILTYKYDGKTLIFENGILVKTIQ